MKKRLLIIACAFALLLGCMAMTSLAAENKTGHCEACNATVTWEPFNGGTIAVPTGETAVHKHYYLTSGSAAGITVKAGVSLCLDLNGQQWAVSGRALSMEVTTNDNRSYLNVQDSVGGATATCRYNGTNAVGGAIYLDQYTTASIYGGTFGLEESSSFSIGGAAHVNSNATLKLYGGTLNGTTASTRGGAVNLQSMGNLHIYGGTIIKGSAPQGNCVNVQEANSEIILSGNAQVDEIYCRYNNKFIVDGAFTGKVNISYNTANVTDLGANKVIGTLRNNGSIAGAEIYCGSYGVAAAGTNLKLVDLGSQLRYHCDHCNETVRWEAFSLTAPTAAGQYHFYLDKDYPLGVAKQVSYNAGVRVCLDLQGHKFTPSGRAFSVSGSGTTLSIMDTVGGGYVAGRAGSNNPAGGTITTTSNTTLNLYSGTLGFVHYAESSYGGCARGGVLSIGSVFNMYGGKIEGGEVVECAYEFTGIEGVGGAIYNVGTLNLQGGEITAGVASGAGPCIYMANGTGKVILGKNVKVADICYSEYVPAQLEVKADFTGTAAVSYHPAVSLIQGDKVGVCGASAIDGVITHNGFTALPENGNLYLSKFPVGTVAATGGKNFTDLQEAINEAADGALVELAKNYTGNVTVNKTIILQMNSCSIDGTVTIAEGCKLYGMDSGTDDYDVADGKYGKITKIVGDVAGMQTDAGVNYLAVREGEAVSFHCVTLQIYAMSLRPEAAGIYYKSHFLADAKAAPLLASYGIALSLNGAPNAETMNTLGVCTVFEGFESGPVGNLGNNSSTLLKGVLKETNEESKNLRNLARMIYGRPYAKTTDGQVLFGAAVSRSLAQQMQAVDQVLPQLSQVQTRGAADMYSKFESVLQTLSLTNIPAATKQEEKGTLKVLSLGHSHGLDGTALLYEVLDAELEEDVIVGALYYSGCSMASHANFLANNLENYDYYKKDKTNDNGKWTIVRATGLDALLDEQWDVVVIQDANYHAGREVSYSVSDYMTVINYIYNNQEQKPRILFHMTWTNPDDYDTYINSASSLSHPTLSWYQSTMEQHYGDANGVYQREIFIDKILSYTEKYLEDCTDFLGEKYIESVIPAATAVEYAQYVCGRTDAEIYRDWTHMNDYGRLIVAYTWYAKIMQLDQVDSIKVTEVPAGAHHSGSKFPADLKFDEQMLADALASVNFALANPYLDIANGDPIPEK